MQDDSTALDEIMEEGEVRNSHRLLLRQGRKQFGNPDAETEAALRSITNLDRLDRLADADAGMAARQQVDPGRVPDPVRTISQSASSWRSKWCAVTGLLAPRRASSRSDHCSSG